MTSSPNFDYSKFKFYCLFSAEGLKKPFILIHREPKYDKNGQKKKKPTGYFFHGRAN